MKNKGLWVLGVVAVLALTADIGALAQDGTPAHFGGVINDYTPITGGTTVWEVRGPWSMTLDEESGSANFSASLTMELSPVGQSSTNVAGVALSQHTHDIKLKGGIVTFNPTDCPAHAAGTPAYTARFEVKGSAIVSANGGPFPPPPATPAASQLQVCIDGGDDNAYSNVTLVFGAPASNHFGLQAIHGVVRKANWSNE
ncbi:MAG TPA: hypothetical protein VKP58_11095 [Candidatus Acidoferrum sp.]|nr:hypothetical protein [Candidatus Acidoferrum sp.]